MFPFKTKAVLFAPLAALLLIVAAPLPAGAGEGADPALRWRGGEDRHATWREDRDEWRGRDHRREERARRHGDAWRDGDRRHERWDSRHHRWQADRHAGHRAQHNSHRSRHQRHDWWQSHWQGHWDRWDSRAANRHKPHPHGHRWHPHRY